MCSICKHFLFSNEAPLLFQRGPLQLLYSIHADQPARKRLKTANDGVPTAAKTELDNVPKNGFGMNGGCTSQLVSKKSQNETKLDDKIGNKGAPVKASAAITAVSHAVSVAKSSASVVFKSSQSLPVKPTSGAMPIHAIVSSKSTSSASIKTNAPAKSQTATVKASPAPSKPVQDFEKPEVIHTSRSIWDKVDKMRYDAVFGQEVIQNSDHADRNSSGEKPSKRKISEKERKPRKRKTPEKRGQSKSPETVTEKSVKAKQPNAKSKLENNVNPAGQTSMPLPTLPVQFSSLPPPHPFVSKSAEKSIPVEWITQKLPQKPSSPHPWPMVKTNDLGNVQKLHNDETKTNKLNAGKPSKSPEVVLARPQDKPKSPSWQLKSKRPGEWSVMKAADAAKSSPVTVPNAEKPKVSSQKTNDKPTSGVDKLKVSPPRLNDKPRSPVWQVVKSPPQSPEYEVVKNTDQCTSVSISDIKKPQERLEKLIIKLPDRDSLKTDKKKSPEGMKSEKRKSPECLNTERKKSPERPKQKSPKQKSPDRGKIKNWLTDIIDKKDKSEKMDKHKHRTSIDRKIDRLEWKADKLERAIERCKPIEIANRDTNGKPKSDSRECQTDDLIASDAKDTLPVNNVSEQKPTERKTDQKEMEVQVNHEDLSNSIEKEKSTDLVDKMTNTSEEPNEEIDVVSETTSNAGSDSLLPQIPKLPNGHHSVLNSSVDEAEKEKIKECADAMIMLNSGHVPRDTYSICGAVHARDTTAQNGDNESNHSEASSVSTVITGDLQVDLDRDDSPSITSQSECAV